MNIAERKIDFSNFTKATLALIPVLGNLILFWKCMNKHRRLSDYSSFYHGYSTIGIPREVFSDKELLLAACNLVGKNEERFAHIFQSADSQYREDPEFVLQLIVANCFKGSHYKLLSDSLKNNRDIVLAIMKQDESNYLIFKSLPENLRNDLEIIKAATFWAKDHGWMYRIIFPHIPNKQVLIDREEWRMPAVQCGVLIYVNGVYKANS